MGMGEFGKKVFAFLSLVIGGAAGYYFGMLVYTDQIALAQYYGIGGSLLYAGLIGFVTFCLVAGVLYKTIHPF